MFAILACDRAPRGRAVRRRRAARAHCDPEIARRAARAVIAATSSPIYRRLPWSSCPRRDRPAELRRTALRPATCSLGSTSLTALLAQPTDRELEARALAHELSHRRQPRRGVDDHRWQPRACPSCAGSRSPRTGPTEGRRRPQAFPSFWLVFGLPAAVSGFFARIVSRHRELAADRGAALLTGSPAALASALRRLSEGLHAIPERDLRVVATGERARTSCRRGRNARSTLLMATHPPLEHRLRELERLEARLQA